MPSYQQDFQPSYQQLRRGSSCNLNQSERLNLLHAEDKRGRSPGHPTPGVGKQGVLGRQHPGIRRAPFPSAIEKKQREILVAFLASRRSKLAYGIGSGLFGLTVSRDDVNVRNKTVYRER
jgi:hypothetical protein